MISTSAWHASDLGSIPSHGRHGIFGVKKWLSTLSLVNRVNVGFILIWDLKEPLRMTSTLAVTILSVSIERLALRKCYETDYLCSSMRPHKIIASCRDQSTHHLDGYNLVWMGRIMGGWVVDE